MRHQNNGTQQMDFLSENKQWYVKAEDSRGIQDHPIFQNNMPMRDNPSTESWTNWWQNHNIERNTWRWRLCQKHAHWRRQRQHCREIWIPYTFRVRHQHSELLSYPKIPFILHESPSIQAILGILLRRYTWLAYWLCQGYLMYYRIHGPYLLDVLHVCLVTLYAPRYTYTELDSTMYNYVYVI